MTIWFTIIGMGVITFAIRLSLIELWERITVTSRVRQALRYVPAAVLSAIIMPELIQPDGIFLLSFQNNRLLAGVVAIIVARITGNVLWTIGSGMIILWVLQAVF